MSHDPAARPPLEATRLRDLSASVHPGAPAYDVVVLPEVASTNAEVVERARAGAAAGLVVVAEHQTRGRGRLDRTWETPARAALTFSVLLRPAVDPIGWTWLPLLAGVAVAGAVRQAGVDAVVKWPNDVLVAERKLAGILVERVETPQGPAVVVGIGLNVSQRADELPVELATSLALEGAEVERTMLLAGLLARFAEEYAGWEAGGVAALRAAYVSWCPTLRGQQVRAEVPGGGTVIGEGVGLSDHGGLLVRTAAGVVTVNAGDVVHVRPAAG